MTQITTNPIDTHERSCDLFIRDQFQFDEMRTDFVVPAITRAKTNDEALVSIIGA